MRIQRGAHILRRVRPLHAHVHALGALPKDGGIDLGFVEAAVGSLANKIQRVAVKPMHGRMQISRLNFCRMVTIGL